ncbi:unnamed protein product [Schistocephalus solidus]|uniref:4F5 domain-containing protein n=1 Tax=Schistocephalus solidus TaxID=70667 RepID=A0A183TIL9_SCHSO|nr:unnamed protein product [Schistocephalus solidus]
MARGLQKLQSQQKGKERNQTQQKKHSAADHKKTAAAGLAYSCVVCKAQMPDPKTYKMHFENKHPKNDLPEELKEL